MDIISVGFTVLWIVVIIGGSIVYQLIKQNGRLLLRVENLEHRLSEREANPDNEKPREAGLARGSVVLDFELPDLNGGYKTLSYWRGRRILLVFFDPNCPFSQTLLPDLARLPIDVESEHLLPVIVSTGDADENRRLMRDHGVRLPVLLQEDFEVAGMFRVTGTPMGYLIDERGVTTSGLLTGAQNLLSAASTSVRVVTSGSPLTSAAVTTHPNSDSVVNSRLLRTGLTSGATAPDFRLPRVDGGDLALADYRGQRVMLVFSDPACGPCDELAPQLEQIHRRAQNLVVLMISRREREANEAKVTEHGLTFPIGLQRHWEISHAYGMFATPIAFLVDERGVIAADVAVGVEPILALAVQAIPPSSRQEVSVPNRTF